MFNVKVYVDKVTGPACTEAPCSLDLVLSVSYSPDSTVIKHDLSLPLGLI